MAVRGFWSRRWQAIERWAARHETAAFLLGLALATGLIAGSTLLPGLRRNAQLATREADLDRQLLEMEGKRKSLDQHVEALQSCPYTIEMTMRERLHKRRPDGLPLDEWLQQRAGSAVPTAATPGPAPATDNPTTP